MCQMTDITTWSQRWHKSHGSQKYHQPFNLYREQKINIDRPIGEHQAKGQQNAVHRPAGADQNGMGATNIKQ